MGQIAQKYIYYKKFNKNLTSTEFWATEHG